MFFKLVPEMYLKKEIVKNNDMVKLLALSCCCHGNTLSSSLFLFKTKSPHLQQEQGWHRGENARLPLIRPGFDSWTQRHMWVEFVVGSLLCS